MLDDINDYNFKIKIPEYFKNKINFDNPNDPLLLQVMPQAAEGLITPGFNYDPLNETKYNNIPGLLHKYKTRVLITLATNCSINCRYCFRRHFDYKTNNISLKNFDSIIDYIKKNKNINEVIYSGGDPLLAPNKYIQNITNKISKIDHIKYIRIHSRIPIVDPDRINQSFCDIFNNHDLAHIKTILVTHCNHPDELDDYIKSKMQLLKNNNITVLNQSVLLKNINNDPNILTKLSYKLFDCNIMPYYIHMLDPVQNAGHFQVDKKTALDIMHKIKAMLPGYLVPKLMQEIPGEKSKTEVK
tara:strand:+ start:16285 stop:17184 length:900 start_codon:yes stop_codon:yes gene_type:complete